MINKKKITAVFFSVFMMICTLQFSQVEVKAANGGWKLSGSKWNYIKSDGGKRTGWLQSGSKWYYLGANGDMQTGWAFAGGKWYYLNTGGDMATGWKNEGGKWYYLKSSGEMAANAWINQGSKSYYLKVNGAMAVNETTPDGYVVGADGAWNGKPKAALVSGQLKIHYIDVGQADAILIQQGGQAMLIDAGNNADSDTVKNYIANQGITQLDYIIGTHPHEDHIGGMDYIINAFKIGKIYMPKATSTTATFQDVITAIKNKGMQITAPTAGESFKLGNANCTILGPVNSISGNLNTYSIVIKVVFGNNKFLFTGDAEASNEQDMIKKGYDLSADVLKVGHHGSSSSTSEGFLSKVNPSYAVISVGKDNDYGHPHQSVVDRLKAKAVKVYHTDESGTVVCTSDGKSISFNCNPSGGSSSGGTTNDNTVVYKTKTGECYHMDGCSSLSMSKIQTTIKDAKAAGLKPCSKCHPPQ